MISPVDNSFPARAERVAARLDLIGPRLAARESSQAREALVAVRDDLQALADLVATADAEQRRVVPILGAHALGDQLRVLAHDVSVSAEQGRAVLVPATELLAGLAARL